MDLLDLFERGSAWTADRVAGAAGRLDGNTPCDDWDVGTLCDHLVDSMRYFEASARGEKADPPGPKPPSVAGDDPGAAYREARDRALTTFRQPGVADKMGASLGIAFVDQLVHGWDVAAATGQDTTIPDDLAAAAFSMVDGQLTPDRRGTSFKPELDVAADASAGERLLAYTGRNAAS